MALKSNEITKQGIELLSQSIEAYLYAVLGAQARSKQYNNRVSTLEVQKVFRLIIDCDQLQCLDLDK